MKTIFFLVVIYSLKITAQNVSIPDANFKNYLLGDASINTNSDTEIQVSEATAFTGGISVFSYSIADLTGIEAFTALTTLDCSGNLLTSLNVSANTALTILYCYINSLTSLDVSANTALTTLYCGGNSLTSLDISANTALKTLYCGVNSITNLDVSANIALIDLLCVSNSLTSLNVKNGNNINFIFNSFNATNNPSLTCIEVDDVIWANANWSSGKDATASFSADCTIGIETIDGNNSIVVYPNPALNSITIEIENANFYQLRDVVGKILLSSNVTSKKFNIDISHFGKGIYLLTLFKEDQQIQRKIVKE